jgi:hypothetical protein
MWGASPRLHAAGEQRSADLPASVAVDDRERLERRDCQPSLATPAMSVDLIPEIGDKPVDCFEIRSPGVARWRWSNDWVRTPSLAIHCSPPFHGPIAVRRSLEFRWAAASPRVLGRSWLLGERDAAATTVRRRAPSRRARGRHNSERPSTT